MTPQKKTSCHIFKMAIFSKFFGNAMSHIIRQNAGRKINTIPELFIKQKIEFKFVLLSSPQSLYWYQIITPLCVHSAFGAEGAKALMFLDSSGVKWNFSIKGHRTQTIICHEFCWTFAALKCLNWSNIWIMEFQGLLFHCLFYLRWKLFE